jgi:hypothetical protein
VYLNLPFINETGLLSVALPNRWNVLFNFGTVCAGVLALWVAVAVWLW